MEVSRGSDRTCIGCFMYSAGVSQASMRLGWIIVVGSTDGVRRSKQGGCLFGHSQALLCLNTP
jgi:hypothetical protein